MKTRKNDAIPNIGGYRKEIFDSFGKFANRISATFGLDNFEKQLQKTIDKTSRLSVFSKPKTRKKKVSTKR